MLTHLLDGVGNDGAATGLEASVFAIEFFNFFIDPVAKVAVHADGEFDNFFGIAHGLPVIPSAQKRGHRREQKSIDTLKAKDRQL